jgi:hypothetical protein
MRRFELGWTFVLLASIWVLSATLPIHAQELAILTTESGGTNHRFGFAVAIDGDTVVVGAPTANGGRGAAYVFVRPVGDWADTDAPTAILTDESLNSNAAFGSSVAISGTTIVVGAPRARTASGAQRGMAAVYVKPAGTWVDATEPLARLTDAGSANNEQFGFAVAIDGNDVVVGAPDARNKRGEIHVFRKPGGAWTSSDTPTATLSDQAGGTNDHLGFSIAISGDTIVAGAYGQKIGGKGNRGAAYVFTRPGANWVSADTPTAKLTASDGNRSDQFGNSVAIEGSSIVVGAWLKDVDAKSDRGAAYLFLKPGSEWTTGNESAILLSSDGNNTDTFGTWVDVEGSKIIVGASLDDGADRNEGSVYVFVEPVTGWTTMTETTKLSAGNGGAGDALGFAAAISGNTVVAGAPNDDVGANTQQGSARVFDVSSPGVAVGAVLPPAEIGASYNASIAISGGVPPFVVSDNNTLPSGLNVDNSGTISGTPGADAKSGRVSFSVTDQNGATSSKSVNLTIVKPVVVAIKNLARGKVGKNYRSRLRAQGGKGPYSWSIAAGALPPGLAIDDENDAITGVPSSAAGSPFSFTIEVTDALGGSATQPVSVTVNP